MSADRGQLPDQATSDAIGWAMVLLGRTIDISTSDEHAAKVKPACAALQDGERLRAENEKLKAKAGEAGALLGPWGGTPAGTIGAIDHLVGEHDYPERRDLRDALIAFSEADSAAPASRETDAPNTEEN